MSADAKPTLRADYVLTDAGVTRGGLKTGGDVIELRVQRDEKFVNPWSARIGCGQKPDGCPVRLPNSIMCGAGIGARVVVDGVEHHQARITECGYHPDVAGDYEQLAKEAPVRVSLDEAKAAVGKSPVFHAPFII